MVEAGIAASALRLRISSTKVTISVSNHNASKEVLEKFKHPCESNHKKRNSRISFSPPKAGICRHRSV
jgi:hypothetical protein